MSRGLPISILLHLLVLAALAIWGGLTPVQPIDQQHVLRVQLATLPETLTEPEPAAVNPPVAEPEPEPEPEAPEPEPEPQPVVEPDPVLPPKEVPVEEPEPEPEPEPVEEPEPRPEPAVSEPATEPAPADQQPDAEPEPAAAESGPAVSGTDEAFPFDYYLRTVRTNIARNWQPKQLGFSGQSHRTCVVHFVINRAGQVSQVTLVRSSGVSLYDREALRAVKASRMPPLPGKFASPSLGVTFTFTLQSGV
jgi:TonB family protein